MSNEIVTFSQEQLEVLPMDVRQEIVLVQDYVKPKELMVLNPVILKLLEIQEFQKIKYVPDNKECIAEYKSAIKETKSLNAAAGSAKTALKKPFDEVGKSILNIEKFIKSQTQIVQTSLQTEFKEYLDAEAKKKQIAAKKKEDAKNAEIDKLAQENKENQNKIAQMNITTDIRVVREKAIRKRIEDSILHFDLKSTQKLKDEFSIYNWEEFTKGLDLSILEPETIAILQEEFSDNLLSWKRLIENKIEQLELAETQKEQLIVEKAKNIEPAPPAFTPQPVQNIMSNFDSNAPAVNQDMIFELNNKSESIDPYDSLLWATEKYIEYSKLLYAEAKETLNYDVAKRKKISGNIKLMEKVLTYLKSFENESNLS